MPLKMRRAEKNESGAWAFFFVPEELYQGATAKIMYIHVPAAMVSLAAYASMAVCSLLFLTLKHSIADVAAKKKKKKKKKIKKKKE